MISDKSMIILAFVLALSFVSVCLLIYYNSTRVRDEKEIMKKLESLIEKSIDLQIKERVEHEWKQN